MAKGTHFITSCKGNLFPLCPSLLPDEIIPLSQNLNKETPHLLVVAVDEVGEISPQLLKHPVPRRQPGYLFLKPDQGFLDIGVIFISVICSYCITQCNYGTPQ